MSLCLKRVQQKDVDLLYKWANDKTVRANSFNTEQIPYETHVKWFNSMLDAPDVYMYILYEDDIPTGQIRINVEGKRARISFSVAENMRGRGFGKAMLSMLPNQIKKDKISCVTQLEGEVKYGNSASSGAFEKCGYTRHEKEECLVYTFDLWN